MLADLKEVTAVAIEAAVDLEAVVVDVIATRVERGIRLRVIIHRAPARVVAATELVRAVVVVISRAAAMVVARAVAIVVAILVAGDPSRVATHNAAWAQRRPTSRLLR
jgi:hypothetical protein